MKLKLGTRGSTLARTQSTTIARQLQAAGFDVELTVIRTSGDNSTAESFASIGPQGVFVREIEQALLDRSVDLAVHSFKDLPTASPDELVVAAVPDRHDVADLLIADPNALGDDADPLKALREGARIGTASARRRVWLEYFRPDLEVASLRGNVPTRIERLKQGRYDAILLAASGVGRLRAAGSALDAPLAGLTTARLDPERFVPAPAQGALAVQCRRDNDVVCQALAALDHAASRAAVQAERAALARAEGGCDTAFGAYCRPSRDGMALLAMLERGGQVRVARVQSRDTAALTDLLFAELDRSGKHHARD
jgi:hydroxymethylbilane synthase